MFLGKRQRIKAPTVWKHFFELIEEDDFIRVRVKNSNLIYIGKLLNYSLQTDNQVHEISLRQYDVIYETTSNGDKKFVEYESFFEDHKNIVYLRSDNIQSVERMNFGNKKL